MTAVYGGMKEIKNLSSMFSFLSTTNMMQRYTIFFITVDALHFSGGFSAHRQELKNCTHSIWYVPVLLLLAWLGWFQPNHASGSSSKTGIG
jgi:hypothetical protein